MSIVFFLFLLFGKVPELKDKIDMSCFSNFGYNKSKFWQRNQKQFIKNLLNNSTLWQSPFHIHPY